MNTTQKAFGVREFCERNDICRDTFYAEVRTGRLRARKIGRKTIVTDDDERRWRDSLPILELAGGTEASLSGEGRGP
jgi:hypothetical protein